MNKKMIASVSVAVIAAFLLMLGVGKLTSVGQETYMGSRAVEMVATLLVLPVRLYAYYFNPGWHGFWSILVLIPLLALSGLMWGVVVERIVWICSKRNTPQ